MIFSINKRFTNIMIYVIIIYVKLYSEAFKRASSYKGCMKECIK